MAQRLLDPVRAHGVRTARDSMLDRALRRERAVVFAALTLVVAASWAWLWSGAGTMEDMGGMLMPMSSGPWTPAHALVIFSMWVVMMAAMMLPSISPFLMLYARIARQRSQSAGSPGMLALGYLSVWSGFSAVAALLQYGLERTSLLSPMMESTSLAFAGATLVGAGLYQWTPVKQGCLRRCRSPFEYVLFHWRDGPRGAFAMGVRHGAHCAGCCAVLMLLLFVGGVMNLAWIGALALYVLAEKLAPFGPWTSRVSGAALIAWGAATLAGMVA